MIKYIVVLFAALLISGCVSQPTPQGGLQDNEPSGNKYTHLIEITPSSFIPSEAAVQVSIPVSWRNADTKARSFAIDKPDGVVVGNNIQPGESFNHTFEEKGTYNYIDIFNPSITGIIVVE